MAKFVFDHIFLNFILFYLFNFFEHPILSVAIVKIEKRALKRRK